MQTVPERWLTGDENAIVDFRYTPSDRLNWYFDHHVTAFASDAQRDQALQRKNCFFDVSYGSCTKLIADVGRDRFNVDFSQFEELVSWADKIDSASFSSAEEAIDRRQPMPRMAAVVEQHGDAELLAHLVPEILAKPIEEVATSDYIESRYLPIGKASKITMERIGDALVERGDVVFVDLHDAPLKASGKFVAYALAPKCVYSIALIRMKQHFKITIGYNPWCDKPRKHDIASLCQRYGGGGHPVVGAVSLPLKKLDEARKVAETLIMELGGDPPPRRRTRRTSQS